MSKATLHQKGRLYDILNYLRDHPGATQAQIMQVLGITSKSHFQKYLDLARENGLVRATGSTARPPPCNFLRRRRCRRWRDRPGSRRCHWPYCPHWPAC
jgi:DNA-binding transcriptional regulator LsrR (DeoR family)